MRAGRWFAVVTAAAVLLAGGCEQKGRHEAEPDLGWAARDGDIQEVQSLIARGVSVHVTDSNGRTPLHNAAERGHLGVAQLLVRYGARIDAIDNRGSTPAVLAMAGNHRPVVEYLVGEGAAVDLFLATYLGDTAKAQEFIAGGADVNAKGPRNWTPLHYAARCENVDVVKLLLAHGANPDVRNDSQRTPLHLAAGNGLLKIAELLIAAGANVNAECGTMYDGRGQTPLHRAIVAGRLDMVDLLIRSGADLNVAYNLEGTPLILAVEHGRDEIMRRLIEAGADIEACDRNRRSPLLTAADRGEIDMAEVLLAAGADIKAKDEAGQSVLHLTFQCYGNVVSSLLESEHPDWGEMARDRREAVKTEIRYRVAGQAMEFLIAHDADVNARDGTGATVLHLAAHEGQKRIAEILLAGGADVNRKARRDPASDVRESLYFDYRPAPGATPLHAAAEGGDPNVAGLLIAHGALVQAQDDSGRTPLHCASEWGHAEVVALLIANGADIDAKSESGETPLVEALLNEQATAARCLVAAGADRVVLKGRTNTRIAGRERKPALLLHNALSPRRKSPIPWDVRRRQVPVPDAEAHGREWIEILLVSGADPNERDEQGNTPLQAAIINGDEEIARLFLTYGSDVNTRNNAGLTALHYAAAGNRGDLVSSLLDGGADVNARDKDGDTPLHGAALRGHKEVVELLVAHGADSSIRNSRDRTPRDEALRRGHGDVVELLNAKP